MKNDYQVVAFRDKKIRRRWDEKEEKWYFSVVTKCNRLRMIAEDGKLRFTDVADVETLLRLIQRT